MNAYGLGRAAAQGAVLRAAAVRRREGRRLRDLYELGDISRADFDAKRAAVRSEIASLDGTDSLARPEVLERLRGYLAYVPGAWRGATSEQRQKLVRTLFEEIIVEDDRVVGAIPGEEYRPFFVLGLEHEHPDRSPETCGQSGQGVLSSGLEGIRTPDLGLDRAAC